jgi:hypothetical protein
MYRLGAAWRAFCRSRSLRRGWFPAVAGALGASLALADETAHAKKLYLLKCARCHKFYSPAAYADAEWQAWMTKMSEKAGLTAEEDRLLSRYLELFR